MKGRVVILDYLAGRAAAALMVDGKLMDLLIDPPEGSAPMPGAIARARAERPLKGQGGVMLGLGDGHTGYLRRAKDIRPGDSFLVQVSGVAEPGKAIPVTPDLIFKSRYAIVTPRAPGLNISRRIRDEEERDRLLEIAHEAMGESHFGLILRSAAGGVDAEAIAEDIAAMRTTATRILDAPDQGPEWLLAAEDAHGLAWRDWADPDPDEVVRSRNGFETHAVHEAIAKLQLDAIPLTGGGHLHIEPTRALIAVDVNTGKDHSLAAGLRTNLAAARDLPRLLRIKGFGGQIILDLAPMPKRDRKMFEDALRKAFRQDGAEVVVAGWTPLGNLELTRKRDRLPLSAVISPH